MADAADEPEEIRRKLDEFSDFVRNILRPDYSTLQKAEQQTRSEIAAYKDLETKLHGCKHDTNTRVDGFDLGYQALYCAATLEDPALVTVDLGRGYHAELTIDEALAFTSKRIEFLTDHVLNHQTTKAKKVQAHIEASEQMLDALSIELGKQR